MKQVIVIPAVLRHLRCYEAALQSISHTYLPFLVIELPVLQPKPRFCIFSVFHRHFFRQKNTVNTQIAVLGCLQALIRHISYRIPHFSSLFDRILHNAAAPRHGSAYSQLQRSNRCYYVSVFGECVTANLKLKRLSPSSNYLPEINASCSYSANSFSSNHKKWTQVSRFLPIISLIYTLGPCISSNQRTSDEHIVIIE